MTLLSGLPMLNYFIRGVSSFTNNLPVRRYSMFDYVKKMYSAELTNILNYYQNRERAVNNTHILARLITNVTPNVDTDINRYMEIVENAIPYIARQFGIVSNISNGVVHRNIFYSGNSYEVLLSVNNTIDIFELEDTWIKRSAVEVVYNEITDLDFHVPNGSKMLPAETLSIYQVDLTLLLLQYKYWALERIRIDASTNPNVFIATIVLPNMIPKIFDIALYNRFNSLALYGHCPPFKINHPFNVVDRSRHVDNIYLAISKDIVNQNKFIEQYLKAIPLLTNNTALELLHINKPYHTRQSEWVLWLARIKYIQIILELLGEKGRRINRTDINTLLVKIKYLERRETNINNKLPGYLLHDFNNDIAKIKNII